MKKTMLAAAIVAGGLATASMATANAQPQYQEQCSTTTQSWLTITNCSVWDGYTYHDYSITRCSEFPIGSGKASCTTEYINN